MCYGSPACQIHGIRWWTSAPSMRERAHLVGGGVSVSSAADAGTTVVVRIAKRQGALFAC